MARIAFLGDSLTATGLAAPTRTFNSWLSGPIASMLGPQFDTYINHGVGGETIAQCLVRVPAVLADTPDIVVVNCGINDLSRPDATFEDMQASYLEIISQLVRAEVRIVCCTILDRLGIADGGAVAPAQAAVRTRFNTWLRGLRDGVMVDAIADLDTVFYDPTLNSGDGTHPDTDRCWDLAAQVVDAVRRAAQDLPRPTLGANLLGTGDMLGAAGLTSAGFCTGQLPTGWRVIGGASGTETWECSPSYKDKFGATRIALGGTPSGVGRNGFLRRTDGTDLAAGQRVILGYDLKLEAVRGVVGVMAQLSLPLTGGTQYLTAMQHRSDTGELFRQLPANYTERFWSLPYTAPEALTGCEVRFGLYYLDDAPISGTVTIGNPVVCELI